MMRYFFANSIKDLLDQINNTGLQVVHFVIDEKTVDYNNKAYTAFVAFERKPL